MVVCEQHRCGFLHVLLAFDGLTIFFVEYVLKFRLNSCTHLFAFEDSTLLPVSAEKCSSFSWVVNFVSVQVGEVRQGFLLKYQRVRCSLERSQMDWSPRSAFLINDNFLSTDKVQMVTVRLSCREC